MTTAQSVDWSGTHVLSRGDVIDADDSGRYYILDDKGLHEYPLGASRVHDVFEMRKPLLVIDDKSVYCIERPFGTPVSPFGDAG